MIGKFLTTPLLYALISCHAFGQDGGQLFTQTCSACHGQQGEGNPIAGVPPLANSEWVTGTPGRAISIVLQGLNGPLEIGGKTYDSAMPGHGAVLDDKGISAVLNFVRSNWGNTGQEEITPAQVAKERAKATGNILPWETIELLKQFPLPKKDASLLITSGEIIGPDGQKTAISADKLDRANFDPKSLTLAPSKGRVLEYHGEITTISEANFEFIYAGPAQISLKIDGKVVLDLPKGMHPAHPAEGKISLPVGAHPFVMRLTDLGNGLVPTLSWKSNKDPVIQSLVKGQKKPWDTIELVPKDRLLIFRNKIEGSTSSRSIAVGFPSGVSFCFDAENMGVSLVWIGKFMDAGHHWTQRANGTEPPMGNPVISAGVKKYWSEEAKPDAAPTLVFLGYAYDQDMLGLTFTYTVDGGVVKDHFRSIKAGTLTRTVTMESAASAHRLDLFSNASVNTKENGIGIGENAILRCEPADQFQLTSENGNMRVTTKLQPAQVFSYSLDIEKQ